MREWAAEIGLPALIAWVFVMGIVAFLGYQQGKSDGRHSETEKADEVMEIPEWHDKEILKWLRESVWRDGELHLDSEKDRWAVQTASTETILQFLLELPDDKRVEFVQWYLEEPKREGDQR